MILMAVFRWTFLIAGIMLICWEWSRHGRKILKLEKTQWLTLFLLASVNIYLTNIAEIWGIQYMISARACLIYSLSPFLSAIVSYFVLGEELNYGKLGALSLGMCGLAPLVFENYQGQTSWLGDLALLVAVVSSVFGWILLRKSVTTQNLKPALANGVSMFLGGIMALLHSLLSNESWAPLPVTNMSIFIQNAAAMCLISNIICYNLYGYLLKRYTATFMSFAGLITPMFASVFGWLFLKEEVSYLFFVSLSIFSVGLYFFHKSEVTKDLEEKEIATVS